MQYTYIICNNIRDDNICELRVLCHGLHVNILNDYTYSSREKSLQLFMEQLRGCFPRFMKLVYTVYEMIIISHNQTRYR